MRVVGRAHIGWIPEAVGVAFGNRFQVFRAAAGRGAKDRPEGGLRVPCPGAERDAPRGMVEGGGPFLLSWRDDGLGAGQVPRIHELAPLREGLPVGSRANASYPTEICRVLTRIGHRPALNPPKGRRSRSGATPPPGATALHGGAVNSESGHPVILSAAKDLGVPAARQAGERVRAGAPPGGGRSFAALRMTRREARVDAFFSTAKVRGMRCVCPAVGSLQGGDGYDVVAEAAYGGRPSFTISTRSSGGMGKSNTSASRISRPGNTRLFNSPSRSYAASSR